MRLSSVGKRYGARRPWVVRDVSASVPAGQLIRVAGRNGSGKSTLLKVAAGVLQPSAGRVTGRPRAVAAPLGAGLAIAAVCLLVGSAAGALCNQPLLRHPGVTLLSTLTAVVIALVAQFSPAAAALARSGTSGAGTAAHWPGPLASAGAAFVAVIAWTASAWAAARREGRTPLQGPPALPVG